MTAHRLSMLAAALMAAASAAGLLRAGLYRDNVLVASGWYGNDLVTLAVASPLLLASSAFARRGSARALLVMFGMLDYALYNYAFYLFGAAFNALFLVYVAVVVLAAAGLIFGLSALDARGFDESAARVPARPVAVFMLVVAAGLGGFWVATSLAYVLTGEVPAVVTAVGHPTNVIAALDLSMVVPLMLIAGVWLWQRRPWGYVLAVIANVKGAAYMLALSAATVAAVRAGASDDAVQLALWAPINIGSLVASAALLPFSPGGRRSR
jgi:hypothetical protein